LGKTAVILKTSTLLHLHRALVKRKYYYPLPAERNAEPSAKRTPRAGMHSVRLEIA
jgi:hypothetical protein